MLGYITGYCQFSGAWLLSLLLLLLNIREKRSRRSLTEDDPTSSISFPDWERAEFINKIVKQLWPSLNQFVRKTILSKAKLGVDGVSLGEVPPRITGIKVYDTNVNRKEIIMDVEIVYAGDSEIVFNVKGVPAKVSELGLRGMVRVVLKPLTSELPLFGSVQLCCLRPPEIHYSLGGVAGALEIPGLSTLANNIINQKITDLLVFPNKLTLSVAKLNNKVSEMPTVAGLLRVEVRQGRNIPRLDWLRKSDPYVVMKVGPHTWRGKTINKTTSPVWGEDNVRHFPLEVVEGQELVLEVYDKDPGEDDFIGGVRIPTDTVVERGSIEVSVLVYSPLTISSLSPTGSRSWVRREAEASWRSASAGRRSWRRAEILRSRVMRGRQLSSISTLTV